jgi:hypothetical protein
VQSLPAQVQTLYAELVERLTALDAARTIGDAPGTFVTKSVKGKTYYYFQHTAPGGALRQVYVGRRGPALEAIVRRFDEQRPLRTEERSELHRLCAQLRVGGAAVTDAAAARVLSALAAAAVFRLGGVLVGTHAFIVLGNLLGVRWEHGLLRTEDVDIASDRVLAVAIPDVSADIPRVLVSLEMGFLPVPGLSPKESSTSFKVRGRALRVDLLTPAVGKPRGPVLIHRFGAAAEPLPYLGYLLEDFQPAAVVDGGGVLVHVPHPARFALHKLLVARNRPVSMQTKSEKDIRQAAQLIEVLAHDRVGDLSLAWEALARRGRGWTRAASQGAALLRRRAPDAYAAFRESVSPPRSGA